jgi:glutamyl-tRNA synthetase
MTPTKEVRVRIAPSPTGFLHIGTARTALFNWIFAKQNNGKFILRIEDTDLERSEPRFEKDIVDNLKWLGINWDEGPFRQTDRIAIYQKYIQDLLDKRALYPCFCTKEDLENERQAQLTQGLAPLYSGKCNRLEATVQKKYIEEGRPHVLRFKVPDKTISFKDMVRGSVKFETKLIGDMIVAKDFRTPLYNLAVVIDDHEMNISHVIRGEDHLANTPKQILIQEALGFNQPKYAHLPLILDPDRKKMSKRHSTTSIEEYKQQGYLPDAFINFLVLLGWHPKNDQELFTKQELIEKFEFDRIQKGGAIFNVDKLNWINAQYIRQMDNDNVADLLDIEPNIQNLAIIALLKDRMVKLNDFKELANFFYQLPDYPSSLLVWKNGTKEDTSRNLQLLHDLGEDLNNIQIESLAKQWGKGEIFWPLRVALSGQQASPGPNDILDILGVEEAQKRIAIAIHKLSI